MVLLTIPVVGTGLSAGLLGFAAAFTALAAVAPLGFHAPLAAIAAQLTALAA